MTEIILASASRIRGELLRNAGLNITVDPADVDERLRAPAPAEGPAAVVAPGPPSSCATKSMSESGCAAPPRSDS